MLRLLAEVLSAEARISPAKMNHQGRPGPAYFADRESWRTWLEKNHRTEKDIWLLLYKKSVGRGLTLGEAVEEALCFGWIDSQLRRIDDEKHMLRFSPRKPGSVWSETNLERVERLRREGKMKEIGMRYLPGMERGGRRLSAEVMVGTAPSDLQAALEQDPGALKEFTCLPKSGRVQYVHWITSAKRPETRSRRVAETVRLMREKAEKASL